MQLPMKTVRFFGISATPNISSFMKLRTAKSFMRKSLTPTDAASIAVIDMERTLTQLPFWSSLTEQEQETLRRSAFVRHYEKGAFIHSSDNECLGMLFVLSGEIHT